MTRLAVHILVLLSLAFAAQAQTSAPGFPTKPVRLVVPYPPGGITDILARTIAQRVTTLWGDQTMIVDNRAGASGNIGVAHVAKSAPDGYTLIFGNASTHGINATLFKNLQFDPVKDFEPITNVASVSNVLLVSPDFPGKTLNDLIAAAKAQPGKLTFASNSVGSSNHLSGELLKTMAKIDMLHIPYKSATGAQTDLMGGRVTMMFDNMTTAVPQVRAGKLRALAVTGEKRNPALPDVPTMVESGLAGFVVTPWWGVFAPAGTPRPIIDKLHKDITGVLNMKEVRDFFASQGTDVIANTPQAFGAYVKGEVARWGEVVRASGATAE